MRERAGAAAIHLFLSFILALLTVCLVFGLWYPSPLTDAVGVTNIFLILLAVDISIGPFLTFLVFNKNKKSLRFDLSVIAILQLTAFSYGLWAVAEGRPAWIVFNADRFDLVQVVDIDERRLNEAAVAYRAPSLFGPKFVAAFPPNQVEERKEIVMEAVIAGVDIAQRPNLYFPLEEANELIRIKSRPLESLRSFNALEEINSTLSKWPTADSWLPLKGKAKSLVVLTNKQDSSVVAIVDLKPWN